MMTIIEFFKFITNWEPTEYQTKLLLELVSQDSKKILICAGRRTGKTMICAIYVMYICFESKESKRILLFGVEDQKTGESPLYDWIKRFFKLHPEYCNEVLDMDKTLGIPFKRGFETKNGSVVIAKNAVEAKIRGQGANIVLVDEAGQLKEDILYNAMDTKEGLDSKFIVLSTPPNMKSHIFWKWANEPAKYKFESFNWSEEDTSWFSKEDLEWKKANYSPQRYKTEVQGVGLLPHERTYFLNVDECIEESATVLEDTVNIVPVGTDRSHINVMIDWGISPCPTVVGVVEKLGSRFRVLQYEEYIMELPEEFIPKLAEVIHSFDRIEEKPRVYADSKPIKFRGWLEKYHVTVDYVDFLQHKELMFAQLQDIFKTGHIRIPDKFEKLIEQLKKYHPHKRTGDDYIDCLAGCCYQPQVPLGKHEHGRAMAIPNQGGWSY